MRPAVRVLVSLIGRADGYAPAAHTCQPYDGTRHETGNGFVVVVVLLAEIGSDRLGEGVDTTGGSCSKGERSEYGRCRHRYAGQERASRTIGGDGPPVPGEDGQGAHISQLQGDQDRRDNQ